MRLFGAFCLIFLLSGCAVRGKGILLSVEPATPLDERDLQSHCDLGDQAACALAAPEESAVKPPPKFAIIQGVAVPDRAVFAALLPYDSAIAWFIYDRELNRLWKLHDSRKQKRPGSGWYVQRIEARELEPDRSYELLAGDKEGKLVEARIFRTLARNGKLKFAVVSGLASHSVEEANQRLSAVLKKEMALIVFTGGNVNAALLHGKVPEKRGAALDHFFECHIAARNSLAFAKERRLVPVAATWSEKEFGQPGGDRTFSYKDQAREVFDMFFPIWADESTIVNGPGVSKIFNLGGQSIVLLDDRSFRVPDKSLSGCEAASKNVKSEISSNCKVNAPIAQAPLFRFGTMQVEWAFRQSLRAQQVVWLISAEPWLGLYQFGTQKPVGYADWISSISSRPASPRLSFSEASALVEESQGGHASLTKIDHLGTNLSIEDIPPP